MCIFIFRPEAWGGGLYRLAHLTTLRAAGAAGGVGQSSHESSAARAAAKRAAATRASAGLQNISSLDSVSRVKACLSADKPEGFHCNTSRRPDWNVGSGLTGVNGLGLRELGLFSSMLASCSGGIKL